MNTSNWLYSIIAFAIYAQGIEAVGLTCRCTNTVHHTSCKPKSLLCACTSSKAGERQLFFASCLKGKAVFASQIYHIDCREKFAHRGAIDVQGTNGSCCCLNYHRASTKYVAHSLHALKVDDMKRE